MWVNKVIKVGNSLAVVIPAQLARSLSIKRGDFVIVVLDQYGVIRIKKISNNDAKLLLEKEIKYE